MNLVILKSDIDNEEKYLTAKCALDKHNFVQNWSVDMEDIDKVLRIECSKDLTEMHTIQFILLLIFSANN